MSLAGTEPIPGVWGSMSTPSMLIQLAPGPAASAAGATTTATTTTKALIIAIVSSFYVPWQIPHYNLIIII
jgi:hypothetical protein